MTDPRRFTPATVLLLICAAVACALPAAADPSAAAGDQVVENRGEGEMVLIHTVGSSAAVWDGVAEKLRLGYRVWTFELPGHGDTPTVPDLTIDSAAELFGAYLAENDIVFPVVVGHGMGGMIAMRYAFLHPNDIRKLILIDAGPRQMASPAQKVDIARRLTTDYDEFIAGYFLGVCRVDSIADGLVDQALRTDRASLTQLLMSSFDYDVTADLHLQAVPILVIGSAMMFPDTSTEGVNRMLDMLGFADARTISTKTMPHNGHFMMLENPVYLASIIAAFALKY